MIYIYKIKLERESIKVHPSHPINSPSPVVYPSLIYFKYDISLKPRKFKYNKRNYSHGLVFHIF